MDSNLPEAKQESKTSVESIFLRTVVKKSVYDELVEIAKHYSTGRGHWDIGVAIQVLLEEYNNSKSITMQEKLDMMIGLLQSKEQPAQEKPEEKPKEMELLGGHKIKLD